MNAVYAMTLINEVEFRSKQSKRIYLLHSEEKLIGSTAHRLEGSEHHERQGGECDKSRRRLPLPNNLQVPLETIPDPKRAVDSGSNIHSSTSPAVNEVELLVTVPWTEQEREKGILAGEEDDDRDLGDSKETWLRGVQFGTPSKL